jgi:hypothetical protein
MEDVLFTRHRARHMKLYRFASRRSETDEEISLAPAPFAGQAGTTVDLRCGFSCSRGETVEFSLDRTAEAAVPT